MPKKKPRKVNRKKRKSVRKFRHLWELMGMYLVVFIFPPLFSNSFETAAPSITPTSRDSREQNRRKQ